MKSLLVLITLVATLVSPLSAGSRPLTHIGITNATKGEEPAISKRLFELLVADTKVVLMQSPTFGFGWEPGIKLTEIPNTAELFNELASPNSQRVLRKLLQDQNLEDGLIVYQYDKKNKVARLKLFDHYDGSELLLIKLPLQPDGPMKNSLMRLARRSAIVAIGGSIRFNP